GELGEADDVGLGDGPAAGRELLTDLERLARRPPADRVGDRRRHRGMFLTPWAGCAIASSVDSASVSRRRVSPGRMTSSMYPSAAAVAALRCSSAYSAAYSSRAAAGSSAAAMSRRLTIVTACLAPMTPSWAFGHANV